MMWREPKWHRQILQMGLQVFVIAVTWKFANQADKDKMIELWTPLAQYVAENEPNTLAYEMSFSTDEPLTVFLYER